LDIKILPNLNAVSVETPVIFAYLETLVSKKYQEYHLSNFLLAMIKINIMIYFPKGGARFKVLVVWSVLAVERDKQFKNHSNQSVISTSPFAFSENAILTTLNLVLTSR
jgi:hypothetical protein